MGDGCLPFIRFCFVFAVSAVRLHAFTKTRPERKDDPRAIRSNNRLWIVRPGRDHYVLAHERTDWRVRHSAYNLRIGLPGSEVTAMRHLGGEHPVLSILFLD